MLNRVRLVFAAIDTHAPVRIWAPRLRLLSHQTTHFRVQKIHTNICLIPSPYACHAQAAARRLRGQRLFKPVCVRRELSSAALRIIAHAEDACREPSVMAKIVRQAAVSTLCQTLVPRLSATVTVSRAIIDKTMRAPSRVSPVLTTLSVSMKQRTSVRQTRVHGQHTLVHGG